MLNESSRAGIARVIDVLLPGTDTSPCATGVGAHEALLDSVLTADPSLEPIVTACGDRASMEVEVSVDAIEQWMGEDAHRLIFALQAAYYMSKQVRESLNYPGQTRLPVAEATPDQLCSPELIAPVISRGPIYTPAPE